MVHAHHYFRGNIWPKTALEAVLAFLQQPRPMRSKTNFMERLRDAILEIWPSAAGERHMEKCLNGHTGKPSPDVNQYIARDAGVRKPTILSAQDIQNITAPCSMRLPALVASASATEGVVLG